MLLPQRPVVPVADCPACGTQTVLYGDWDAEHGRIRRRCAACDAVVEPDAAGAEFLAAAELEGTAFEVTGALSPDGGCSGGCSTGGCATCDHVETCEKVH